MAIEQKSRSSVSSNLGRRRTAMNSFESTDSLQLWACSTFSSSENFLSMYEKMQEDREMTNLESLVSTPYIEQQRLPQGEQQHFSALPPPKLMMTDKLASKTVLPHITSRGSLVGKTMSCRTHLHTSVPWRQKSSSTQRMHNLSMTLNYYQDRSSSTNHFLYCGKQQHPQSSRPAGRGRPVTSVQRPEHSLDKEQCSGLFLRLAGAAGMRLICPPVQLSLLEILLFFREQVLKSKAAPLADRRRAGLWRFPVHLAIATLRPFCGSLAGYCLTALLCVAQMRITANNVCRTTSEQHYLMRYLSVPEDLHSAVGKNECNDLDRQDLAKSRRTNLFQTDDLGVISTEDDDDVAAAKRTGQNGAYNSRISLRSNLVVGSEFEENCCRNNDVEDVEILISESEDNLSDDTVPTSRAKDQVKNGSNSVSGRSTDSELSPVDLEEDSSFETCLKLEESGNSSCENVLIFVSRNGIVGVKESAEESFAQSSLAVRPPALRLRWDAPSSSVGRAAAGWSRTMAPLEDSECFVTVDAAFVTDRKCLEEQELPVSTSLSQVTLYPKTSTEEFAEDDEPCSVSRERDELAVAPDSQVSTPQVLAKETVENQVGDDHPDGKLVHLVEGEYLNRLMEQEVAVSRIEEHRTNHSNCVSREGLRMQVEVLPSEKTSTESEPEKEASDHFRLGHFKVEFDGDVIDGILSKKLPEKMKVFLPRRTTDGNETDKADLLLVEESPPLLFEEVAENQAVTEPQKVNPDVCVVDDRFVDSVLDMPINENVICGSVSISPQSLPDLIELLMDANWTGARKEFAKAAVSVKAGRSSSLTGVAENQAVKKRQDEGKLTHFTGEKSAVKPFDFGLEVGCIENQVVEEILEVKSEHGGEEKLAYEVHRADGDDCDDWLESLLKQVEVFIFERADVLNEHEKAAALEVEENQIVKGAQDINPVSPTEGLSTERFLNEECKVRRIEEYRIDDGNWIPLQGDTEFSLSQQSSCEIDLHEESHSASAAMASWKTPSPRLTESLEKEVVKEIQEVNSSNFIEKIHDHNFEYCPVEEPRIGYKDHDLLEVLQGERGSFVCDRTSSEIDAVKGASAEETVALSTEVPSSGWTEFFVDQSIRDIQEVTCCHLVEKYEVVNLGIEVCSIQGDGIQSEDNPSSNHSSATSGQLCSENLESKLICWTSESTLEPSTETRGAWRKTSYARCFDSHERIVLLCILLVPFFCSSTSRLVDKLLDPEGGATAVALGDELTRDERDGHTAVEGKVLDEIESGSTAATNDSQLSDDNDDSNPSSAFAETSRNGENNCFPETCPKRFQLVDVSSTKSSGVTQSCLQHPFADHPKCIELRERRHSHGDQVYIDMQDLLPAPWGQLIFWHGRCKEGRPTLCVLLGRAVRQLPGYELMKFIEVTVSHLEHAELNFFKGNVKQMNILMDLEGLGFMRLPPMHILSAIGAVLNRDYAGRGGWIILVNAPLMLGFVISAIQGVILRPSNNKGAAIDSSFKGFLEGKERIIMMGGKYRSALQKHFDTRMLPVALNGDCPCGSDEHPCKLGNEFLKQPWDSSSHT